MRRGTESPYPCVYGGEKELLSSSRHHLVPLGQFSNKQVQGSGTQSSALKGVNAREERLGDTKHAVEASTTRMAQLYAGHWGDCRSPMGRKGE